MCTQLGLLWSVVFHSKSEINQKLAYIFFFFFQNLTSGFSGREMEISITSSLISSCLTFLKVQA